MDPFLKTDFQALLEHSQGPCVSIFLPTERSHPQIEQNPIRWKNLLRQAEERLAARCQAKAAAEILAPAHELLDDPVYWTQAGAGLAAFAAPGFFRAYRLPLDFVEEVTVGNRFAIKTLLPLLAEEEPFYVLALSWNEVRLLEVRGLSVQRVTVPDMPASLADALGTEEDVETLNYHTATRAGLGDWGAVFHGGAGNQDTKDEYLRYFRRVALALGVWLHHQRAPLVLATVEFLAPIFREVSTYAYLAEEIVAGNPEPWSDEELAARAQPIAQPYFAVARQHAAERFSELIGTGRASSDITEVMPAASHGRVDVLFVADRARVWGVDGNGHGIRVHPEPEPGDEDLLDVATVSTLRNGGTVYTVSSGEVPGGGELAALFRY